MVFFVFLLFSCQSNEGAPCAVAQSEESINLQDRSLVLGAQRIEALLELIGEKKVALVGNQSSMVGQSTHLADTLLSCGVHLKLVFSPEHGFRGTASAGEKINNSVDTKTGLPIVSLYGKHKKPSKEDLEGVELILFDIQDVGVRFYTYISTLHYVMESAAQEGIPLVVLDRPNPNGDYVDGPILEMKHSSFVGMHPIPIVHGMTIGEYAGMVNGQYWLEDSLQCDLTVLKCLNYKHDMFYALPVAPSPNLRSAISIRLYPSLCLFEGTTVSVGRGTDTPFELYGHPKMPKDSFSFSPKSQQGAIYPKHQNVSCGGIFLGDAPLTSRFDLSYLIDAAETLEDPAAMIDKKSFFVKLAGTELLYDQIIAGLSIEEIRESWEPGLTAYKKMRESYLLYD